MLMDELKLNHKNLRLCFPIGLVHAGLDDGVFVKNSISVLLHLFIDIGKLRIPHNTETHTIM